MDKQKRSITKEYHTFPGLPIIFPSSVYDNGEAVLDGLNNDYFDEKSSCSRLITRPFKNKGR